MSENLQLLVIKLCNQLKKVCAKFQSEISETEREKVKNKAPLLNLCFNVNKATIENLNNIFVKANFPYRWKSYSKTWQSWMKNCQNAKMQIVKQGGGEKWQFLVNPPNVELVCVISLAPLLRPMNLNPLENDCPARFSRIWVECRITREQIDQREAFWG